MDMDNKWLIQKVQATDETIKLNNEIKKAVTNAKNEQIYGFYKIY